MPEKGTVGILNVGAGDIVLSFDKNNPSERVRAGRIVKDMLRRGYALLVEVERNGVKAYERALDFDEEKAEYTIADFDPVEAALDDNRRETEAEFDRAVIGEQVRREKGGKEASPQGKDEKAGPGRGKEKEKPRRQYRKRVPAEGASAVSVGPSAGG